MSFWRRTVNKVFGDLHEEVTRALLILVELDKEGHGRKRRRSVDSEPEKQWTENAIASIACTSPHPDDTPANLLERTKEEEKQLESSSMVVTFSTHFNTVRKAIDLGNRILDRGDGSTLDENAIHTIAEMAVENKHNLTLRRFDEKMEQAQQPPEHAPAQFIGQSPAR